MRDAPQNAITLPTRVACALTLTGVAETWPDTQNFKKCLIRMFAREKLGVVFMETVMQQKQNRHTFIECIPLPVALADEAPLYFKVGMLSSFCDTSKSGADVRC